MNETGRKAIDLIWNISLICPWNCTFCCTDAVHVSSSANGVIHLWEQSLGKVTTIPFAHDVPCHLQAVSAQINKFDIALINRQARGLELTYEQKMMVLENLTTSNVSFDFAGGDPLACYENFLVIKRASELFGRSAISITSTGASLTRYGLNSIAELIGKFEFTFDEPIHQCKNRPKSYNNANINVAQKFARLGIKTKAQIPLHSGNLHKDDIEYIYTTLCRASINEILLMRLFPVGRAQDQYRDWTLPHSQYIRAIDEYRRLAAKLDGPKIRLQCALRYLYHDELAENPCDAIKSSFGINWKGDLLISAWANNSNGDVLDKTFILGNLTEQPLKDIQSGKLVEQYLRRSDDNYGHCKVFAFIHSSRSTAEALFDRTDPLFTE